MKEDNERNNKLTNKKKKSMVSSRAVALVCLYILQGSSKCKSGEDV